MNKEIFCKECGTRDPADRLELCHECGEFVCWEHRQNEKFGIHYCKDCYQKLLDIQNSPNKESCAECGSTRDLKEEIAKATNTALIVIMDRMKGFELK